MNLDRNSQKWLEKFLSNRFVKAQRICETLRNFSKKNSPNNPIILDLGCYDGSMEEYFVNYTNNLVVGIDLDHDALKNGSSNLKKKHLKNLEFITADAQALPIKDGKIDWLICNQVVDYSEDKNKVIEETKRVLSPNGMIYLSVVNSSFLKLYRKFPFLFVPYLGPFYGRVYPSSKSKFGSPMNYDYWTKQEIMKSIFEIKDVTPYVIIEAQKNSQQRKPSSFSKTLVKLIYPILSHLFPSWVFLLYHKVK